MIIKPTKTNAPFEFKATPKIPTSLEGIKEFYMKLHGTDFWDISVQERAKRQKAYHESIR